MCLFVWFCVCFGLVLVLFLICFSFVFVFFCFVFVLFLICFCFVFLGSSDLNDVLFGVDFGDLFADLLFLFIASRFSGGFFLDSRREGRLSRVGKANEIDRDFGKCLCSPCATFEFVFDVCWSLLQWEVSVCVTQVFKLFIVEVERIGLPHWRILLIESILYFAAECHPNHIY